MISPTKALETIPMRVAIIGGTGFIGGYLVDALLADGHAPSLLVRHGSDSKVRHRNACSTVHGDLSDDVAIDSTLADCAAVIFNVGILREEGDATFERLQLVAVERVIEAAKRNGVKRFLLMSANGVHKDGTDYQRSKYLAEEALRTSGLDYTIFRPSIVFGDPRGLMEIGTQLLNDVVRLPIPAAGFTTGLHPRKDAVMMSPVHVRDVADAFTAALANDDTIGKTFALGGPDELSWAEIVKRVGSAVGKNKWVLPVPIFLVKIPVSLLDWIPSFPVTRDQLTMLAEGNTADAGELESLIRRPARRFSVEALQYLDHRRAASGVTQAS